MSPTRTPRARFAASGLLGAAAAVLISCGGSHPGLIPTGNAGPLQSDFEEVVQDAQTANGSCGPTVAAIQKTEGDFAALPSTVAVALRSRLREGISNLRARALVLCRQPLGGSTATSTSPKTTTTTTTTTPTTTTPTRTQTTSTEATTPSTVPGGATSPGTGGAEALSGSSGGQGATQGAGAGGAGGAGGQEPAK